MSDAEKVQEKFEDTPQGWARLWESEFRAADRELKKWHERADDAYKRFHDDRADRGGRVFKEKRLNLFWSNVITMRALLYGKTPQVDVDRRFQDAADDPARAAAEILRRLLNLDIERNQDGFVGAIRHALEDKLIAGLGNVKLRYDAKTESKHVPEKRVRRQDGSEITAQGYDEEALVSEDVAVDYVHWRDQKWSPSRTFDEVRWWAFLSYLPKADVKAKWGEKVAEAIPYTAKQQKAGAKRDWLQDDPRDRAEVWEIWDKERKKIWWVVRGHDSVLGSEDDIYGLKDFWPFPTPMFSNVSTLKLVPTPDHTMAKEQYDEIDNLTTRIVLLESALRAVGVYDSSSEGLKRLLSEAAQNEMIPVANWGQFASQGGIKGAVDWFPLDQIVEALTVLRDYRKEVIQSLYEVTGMSDVIRGQAAGAASATEQAIKARFASVRVQDLQDEFARFASDVQRIKVELISRKFQPQTILQRSNIGRSYDAQMAQQAVALIKAPEVLCYRITVRPESVSMPDFAQIKQERSELILGIATFMQSAAPLAQGLPGAMPYLIELLKWLVSGYKGSDQAEAILDQAVAGAQRLLSGPQPPQQPDPKLQTAQAKGQMDLAKVQAELQADLMRTQAETQSQTQQQAAQAHFNVAEEAAKQRIQARYAVAKVAPRRPGGAQ